MATKVKARGWDFVSKIAARNGFGDFHILWDHPDNAALKAKRKNPNTLLEGDELTVPDKKSKVESGATGRTHFFQVKMETLKVRVLFIATDKRPVRQLECTYDLDGVKGGTTLVEGLFELEIPRTSENLRVTVGDREFHLKVGGLDPEDETSGMLQRLTNMGYETGDSADPEDEFVRSAVEEFQVDHDMPVNGKLDAPTREAIMASHGL